MTGASGFIGLHCVLALLQQGYRVRGTLRDLAREGDLREALEKHVEPGARLEFVAADLLADAGWEAALEGCTYVLHVASPIQLIGLVEPGLGVLEDADGLPEGAHFLALLFLLVEAPAG